MCGIVGYFAVDPPMGFENAFKLIAHRGPDGFGIHRESDNPVVLGHRRLAIIDVSDKGAQPMYDATRNWVIVYNGELYNFRELRDELRAIGVTFVSDSDTEVLLQLFIRFGPAMLNRLRGIFAFAIYDRANAELFVARDALGVKPLYFSSEAGQFAFSSELKSLVALRGQLPRADSLTLSRHLMYVWAPGTSTPAQGIESLAPGSFVRVRNGTTEEPTRWYRLPIHDGTRIGRRRDAIADVEEHLRAAVHRQLVADVPLGSFLSGGLDSSAIVALAREQAPDIQCFTIDTPTERDGFVADLPYAIKAAEALRVPLEIVELDSDRMRNDLVEMVVQLDEPLADPAALNVFYICERAREMGIKVLLSGAGGDDIFTGYRRHQALTIERLWSWLPAPIRRSLDTATSGLDQRKATLRRVSKLFRGAGLSGDERIIQFFRWLEPTTLRTLMSAEVRSLLAQSKLDEPLHEELLRVGPGAAPLDKMLLLEQRFFLADHNLVYTDRMSMAAGVEVRVPFLDEDLVEFAACIPVKYKQRGRTGKWILKKAMEPLLPRDIIHRPKTGFGAPVRTWVRNDLRDLIDEQLTSDQIKTRNYFDAPAVRDLIDRDRRGEIDAAYTIFSLLCIEIWCRHYIDGSAGALSSSLLSRRVDFGASGSAGSC